MMLENMILENVKNMPPSGIRKYFDMVHEMEGVISLGVGEPDFDTPWHIRDEGIYSLEKGKTFYTSNSGLKELKIEISKFLKRKYDLDYDYNDEMFVTVGGSEAIDMALRAMLDPGDEVIIPQPSYVSYVPCTVLANGTPVPLELKAENEFRLTADELRAAITPKSKILIMPFPNNPTGAIMERKDLLDALKSEHLTLSCMESLTGGMFASAFTSIPGASAVFLGGAVTYTDEAKERFGVKKSVISRFGAISKECAKEMALKASLFFQSDCSVSFTGNAGPDAQEGKDVGLVYVGVKVRDVLYTYQLNLEGDREEIRKQCVDFAFQTLIDKIQKKYICCLIR